MLQSKTIQELEVGDYAEKTRKVMAQDGREYARVVGDQNPIHFDEQFAAATVFRKPIVHGMFIAGFISELIGMEMPGQGCIYARQELDFTAPVYYEDEITVRVEVLEKNESKNRVFLNTVCKNQAGEVVLRGTAVVLPRKR